MVTIASIFIVITVVLLHFNIHYRNHWYCYLWSYLAEVDYCLYRFIKRSVPRLNEVTLLGCLAIYLSVVLYGFDGQFFKFSGRSIACCYVRNGPVHGCLVRFSCLSVCQSLRSSVLTAALLLPQTTTINLITDLQLQTHVHGTL